MHLGRVLSGDCLLFFVPLLCDACVGYVLWFRRAGLPGRACIWQPCTCVCVCVCTPGDSPFKWVKVRLASTTVYTGVLTSSLSTAAADAEGETGGRWRREEGWGG